MTSANTRNEPAGLRTLPRPSRVGFVLGGARLRNRAMLLERALSTAEVICLAGESATWLTLERAGVRSLHAEPEERAILGRTVRLLAAAERRGAQVLLPRDVIAYRDYPSTRAYLSAAPEDLRPGWFPGDVGHRTLEAFRDALLTVDTVVWSGPLGRAAEHPFARGSIALARLLSRSSREEPPRLVVSGRDTVDVVRAAGVEVIAGGSASDWWQRARRGLRTSAAGDGSLPREADGSATD